MKTLRLLLSLLLLAACGGWSTAAWSAPVAVPSIQQVYTAASSGRLQQARQEIDQVLAAYPDSAKAHYVSARVAALQGQWSRASAELTQARRLDPGLGFARRDTVAAFARQVAEHSGRTASVRRHGLPLGAIGIGLTLLALLVLWGVYRASRRPQLAQIPAQPWGAYPQQPLQPGFGPAPGMAPGYGPSYPPAPPAGGAGGVLGAVGTGLALGAGVAAGEMLVDKLLDGGAARPAWDGGGQGGADFGAAGPSALPDDQDFGIDDSGSWSDDGSGGWN